MIVHRISFNEFCGDSWILDRLFKRTTRDYHMCEVRCYRDEVDNGWIIEAIAPFVLPIGETWRQRHDRLARL